MRRHFLLKNLAPILLFLATDTLMVHAYSNEPKTTLPDKAGGPARPMTEEQFDQLVSKASRGDSLSLEAISNLYQYSDASYSEGITGALSSALTTNPAKVFQLLRSRSYLPTIADICESRQIEPSPQEVATFYHNAIKAIQSVKSENTSEIKSKCLQRLKSAPK
ncbi:hypothetical protein D5366_10420 [Neokomagataea tanensis]|uniref:Secreted protein n=1 Tax=Neokomagataea tanensis TaxID=661191 RepID=A0A4Y6VA43_9PROT|nr:MULTISPECIES: hypothetical protein [Neokomagataea]QDH25560.1 hypothetical protein D5366_10420 [Neokomagataea tanensis]